MGRELGGVGSEEAVSGARIGNENSGLGIISTGPILEAWRRW